jgi:hypothetical protein
MARHANEFLRALRGKKYERTEGGIYFPDAKVEARGLYVHDVNGEDEQSDPNIVTDQGLTHMLGVEFGATAKISAWYLSLFGGNVTPAANWTAASYPATASEIVSSVEGYTEGTRQAFTAGTAAANEINNNAAKAAFTIATASQLNVYGAALSSAVAKGDTGGFLPSATRFGTTRILSAGDIFNCGYRIVLTSS